MSLNRTTPTERAALAVRAILADAALELDRLAERAHESSTRALASEHARELWAKANALSPARILAPGSSGKTYGGEGAIPR